MILCQDPALSYLNDLGYNVVRLPRSGILPLEVLGRKGGERPESLGNIGTIWTSDSAVPKAAEDVATSVASKVTQSLKLSVGVALLENYLAALGASSPSVRASYRHARFIQFRFGKPKVLKIDPLSVGEYLRSGEVADDNPLIKYFLGDDYRAYVITEVLQSDAISVTAQDDQRLGVDVKVPEIEGVLKGDVKIETSKQTKGDLTFRGTKFLTFGYKAFQIAIVNGLWDLERVRALAENALMAADGQAAYKTLAGPVLEEGFSLFGSP